MIGKAVNFLSADGGTNFIINDRATQTMLWYQSPYYYISLKTAEGLGGSDIDYEAHPIPGVQGVVIGEKSGDVIRRGRGVTLSGEIEALNMTALELGADFLGQMFADTALRKLIWTRYADNVQIYLKCRVNNDLVITQTAESGRYSWQWVVGLRADDPRTRRVDNDAVYPSWQR